MLPFVFEEGFGYERYAEYALDVPMYFVYRDGKYIDAAGQSFRDFLNGRLLAFPGELPTIDDWADHLSTAFPEVRLKQLPRDARRRWRTAGGGSARCPRCGSGCSTTMARSTRRGTWSRTGTSASARRCATRCRSLRWTRRCRAAAGFATSRAKSSTSPAPGLSARARFNDSGDNESGFLDPLREIVRTGKVPAQMLLDRFNGDWGGDISRVYEEARF